MRKILNENDDWLLHDNKYKYKYKIFEIQM
jgi:hypothetical protein